MRLPCGKAAPNAQPAGIWTHPSRQQSGPLTAARAVRPLQMHARGEMSFNIDGLHLYASDHALYNWAVTYPAETSE